MEDDSSENFEDRRGMSSGGKDNYWRWNYWVIILLLNTFGGENVQMSYANIRTNEWRKWRS
jgi:hypothetical protein